MNGEWLIRQHGFEGRLQTERVTIDSTAGGTGNPEVKLTDTFIMFNYTDGREIAFPWANILRAEYRPHTEP